MYFANAKFKFTVKLNNLPNNTKHRFVNQTFALRHLNHLLIQQRQLSITLQLQLKQIINNK